MEICNIGNPPDRPTVYCPGAKMDPASSNSVGTNAPLSPGAELIIYQLLQLTQVLKDLSD